MKYIVSPNATVGANHADNCIFPVHLNCGAAWRSTTQSVSVNYESPVLWQTFAASNAGARCKQVRRERERESGERRERERGWEGTERFQMGRDFTTYSTTLPSLKVLAKHWSTFSPTISILNCNPIWRSRINEVVERNRQFIGPCSVATMQPALNRLLTTTTAQLFSFKQCIEFAN